MGTLKRTVLASGLMLALAGTGPAEVLTVGQTVPGELTAADPQGPMGKYEDGHTLVLAPGAAAVVTLVSEDFDCYLKIAMPDGSVREDDDGAGSLDSRLLVRSDAGGECAVTVTTYGPGETGAYTLSAAAVESARLLPGQVHRGLFDEMPVIYTVPVAAGQTMMVYASSEEFDTVLTFDGPDGRRLMNDDIHGSLNSGLLSISEATGDATLTLDAFTPMSSGEYELVATPLTVMHRFDHTGDPTVRQAARMALPVLRAALFELAGDPGARATVAVNSDDFDTTLYVFDGQGGMEFDDDGGGGTNARMDVRIPAGGVAHLLVVPFDLQTTGQFEIRVTAPEAGPAATPPAAPGELPPFTARDLEGNAVPSSQFDGAVRIVDVWATWCPPCRMEIPHFIELTNRYPELKVVGISVDDGPEVVQEYMQEAGVNYTMLMDDGTTVQSLAQATSEGAINAIPTTFVVGRDGRIASVHIGYQDLAVFESEIQTLLAD